MNTLVIFSVLFLKEAMRVSQLSPQQFQLPPGVIQQKIKFQLPPDSTQRGGLTLAHNQGVKQNTDRILQFAPIL